MNREQLKATLKRAEGVRALPYDDKTSLDLKPGHVLVGTLTVGCGHSLLVPMSAAAIEFLLDEDVTRVITDLDDALPFWRTLNEARQQSLAEMAFQLGTGGLLRFKQMLAALQRGDYQDAARHMLASTWFGQCPGRAKRLAEQMRTGTLTA